MKSFLLLLSIIGCCVGQDLLLEGPVKAVLRKNVTFKTLVELKDFITFVWSFDRGTVLVPIVTLTPTGETVAEGYRGRVRVNRTNGFLTLGPLKASDRGYYSVAMVTSEMKKTGETMLRVLGCCELKALPEGPLDAVSGKNVTFKTLIDPKEEINDTAWFFSNGGRLIRIAKVTRPQVNVVFEGFQGRVTVNQTNGFLTLGPLTVTDSGDYFVNILTAKEKKVMTGELKLRVLEPVSDVTIRASESETVEFNSTVVLTCSAKGSFLKFSWTSGSEPIMADNTRVTIKEDDTSSILTISGIQSSDLIGPIYCTAANQLEMEKSAPFNLTVIFPTTPSVLTLPTRTGLKDGEKEGGNLRATSSHTTTSPNTTSSSRTTTSPYTTSSSHTTTSPYTTSSSRTTTSPYTTSSSRTTTSPYTTSSSRTTTSPYTTSSSRTTTSPYTTSSSRTTTSPYTTSSSRTTTSPYTTTSSHTTTSQTDRETRLDNQDLLAFQRAWFDKLQAELVEMRLSFERSLRQMESRTHSLLWSMSRRMERMTEAMDRNSASSHWAKTYVSIKRLLSAVTPSSQPGSHPVSLQTRNQRRRGGRGGNRS